MELIDGMTNYDGDTLDIYADLDFSQHGDIESCPAQLRDETGTIIKTGTYQYVITWAYRRGYIF